MKIAIFVLADMFVPLMLSTGNCLEQRHGHQVRYLNFLPHDHKLLSKNTAQLFPRNLETLDGSAQEQNILFPQDDVKDMVNFMQLKHGGSLTEWHGRVNAVARYVQRFIDAEAPDLFVLWNGQDHIGQVISVLCRRKDIPVVYLENGYFANTLQADLAGVNASATLAALDYDAVLAQAQSQPPSSSEAQPAPALEIRSLTRTQLAAIALAHRTHLGYYTQYPEQRGSSRIKTWQIKRERAAIPNDQVTLPEHFAFVPLQVHDDTQVLLNSRLVHSVEEFFETVHAAIRRTCGPDYPIIVKEHPEDLGRYDYSELRQKYPDVIWLRKFDIELLLDRATMVFVINSSVGLQAVRRKKPTVVLGESFYSKPEIAFVVKDLAQLDANVQRAVTGVDEMMSVRIDRFLEALDRTLFVKGTWKYPACIQAGPALAERLVALHAGSAGASAKTVSSRSFANS
ncbi:capsular biosynthesis protein [Herbaspirillum sp. AP02]|uniref:capsular polysaccharide export protein, LipB/KpsS family n=1 Tax=unclassified Herbaspirillum TaxID=2624150 RepID=UPI0015D99BD8|nr:MULTISPECIES: capsular biosynthesis protein [unclassified Herbaspirillum]MBG7618464.1 capsular biosynthesis protein [Herbaspirillum sp. AP02]NZD68624.1 capsular biosynthesis protein [Herbaspirillum sp. AP21]